MMKLLLFMFDDFIFLSDLLFVIFHEFGNHLLELDDLIFHCVIEIKWLLKLLIELCNLCIFLFDCIHKFVNNVIRHVDDLLLEETEFWCKSREYSFKVKERLTKRLMWLMVGLWKIATESHVFDCRTVETDELNGLLKYIGGCVYHRMR